MRSCGLVILYSRFGIQADQTNKSQMIREWPSLRTVKDVKSLQHTLQYSAVYMYMAVENGEKTSGELTAPLRYLQGGILFLASCGQR